MIQSSEVQASRTVPKVSVLLPTLNHARFVGEAIESVLEQDFTDFEVIVSDDGSSDGAIELLKDWRARDGRIQLTIQPARLGLAGNANWCLSQARGEYIKFLFTDDKLSAPDALGRLVGALENDSRVVLASSAALIIDERSQAVRVRDYFGRNLVEEGQATCRRCLLSGVNRIGEPSLWLFRRRCVSGGFDPSYRLWVDVEFACRVLERGWFAYRAEPLTAFRVHEGQETRGLMEGQLWRIELCRLLGAFAERPWLGRDAARQRLFEERYQAEKRADWPRELRMALDEALTRVGGQGYTAFKVFRPLRKLRRSLAKRLAPRVPQR